MNKKIARKKTGGKKVAVERAGSQGITEISVKGFKSLVNECAIEVRPLTILAGANSSGKSSIMQPLLMLKQTLEAGPDRGALLFDGSNARFTSADQILSKLSGEKHSNEFSISLKSEHGRRLTNIFKRLSKLTGIELFEMNYDDGKEKTSIRRDMGNEEILEALPKELRALNEMIKKKIKKQVKWKVGRYKCFFGFEPHFGGKKDMVANAGFFSVFHYFEMRIRELIHIPALRGNPERTYKTTAIGNEFPGTFEIYVASVINNWQDTRNNRLEKLESALMNLGLTRKIEATRIDDTQVELLVSRVCQKTKTHSKHGDLVSIADVGYGVSQVLPVLVALLVAKPGQMVYIEEPEIHLHPRAQLELAKILIEAANRGVRVVLETHSDLLILGIQSLVAKGKFPSKLVKLHWFTLRHNGATKVDSTDMDDAGAYGDWPEDFADTSLKAESNYLEATEKLRSKKR